MVCINFVQVCFIFFVNLVQYRKFSTSCLISQTTASGTEAKPGPYCSGDIIFNESFDRLDLAKWKPERTLSGQNDWQFQWYVNNRSNAYVRDGKLYLYPTLTSDIYGESFITSGFLSIHGELPAESCTNAASYGCERRGTPNTLINPVRSTKLRSYESFSFRYGKVEIRAKLSLGDWLWPHISLSPTHNQYGDWPASGSITFLEARGNERLFKHDVNIGVDEVSSSIYYGPCVNCQSHLRLLHSRANKPLDFCDNFHIYTMDWSPEEIVFKLDNQEVGSIPPMPKSHKNESLWISNVDNPWIGGTKMAPFDEEFHFNIALAVGGMTFFPDDANGTYPKPWSNDSPDAFEHFWDARNNWLPTWNLKNKNTAAFVIDYIKVFAI